jgi:hypothetical protein
MSGTGIGAGRMAGDQVVNLGAVPAGAGGNKIEFIALMRNLWAVQRTRTSKPSSTNTSLDRPGVRGKARAAVSDIGGGVRSIIFSPGSKRAAPGIGAGADNTAPSRATIRPSNNTGLRGGCAAIASGIQAAGIVKRVAAPPTAMP